MAEQVIKRAPFSWLKQGGEPLPKRVLRPFTPPPYHALDDTKLVLLDGDNRTIWLNSAKMFSFLIAAIAGVGTLATSFHQPISIFITIVALSATIVFQRIESNSEYTKFNIFDRGKGVVRYHLPWLLGGGVLEAPWSEFSGRLVMAATRHGDVRHNLVLFHNPTVRGFIVRERIGGIEPLLETWSFLVQYMDNNAPLPDVQELKQYPNRTAGLGAHWEWENRIRHNQPDPYYVWLDEVKRNPALDILNHAIEERRNKRSS